MEAETDTEAALLRTDAGVLMEDNRAIIEINKAQQALERAHDIHEILDLRDKAAAFVLFADARGYKDTAQIAKIFQLDTERKAGDWLRENVDHRGATAGNEFQDGTGLPDGVDKKESHRWQLQASLPKEKYDEWKDECLAKDLEISASSLRGKALEYKRTKEVEELKDAIESGALKLPEGLFEVIVIDPPWPYETVYDPDGRRAASPYPEQSLEEIAEMEIPASDDCILWLWTTHKFMRHSFELLDKWGFRDVAIVTWVKEQMGLGYWLRSKSEFCIMAVKGKPLINLTNQTTVITGQLREHSRKPDEFYEMVDSLCIGRKLDYYSREQRKGWEQFGNEMARFTES